MIRQPLPTIGLPALTSRLRRRSAITDEGCWLWVGAADRYGYGKVQIQGITYQVHRLAYRSLVEDIDCDLTIDHLCRHTMCWRLDHLDAVPQLVNNHRSPESLTTINAAKLVCPAGHEYTDTNTYLRRRPTGLLERECKTCRRQRKQGLPRLAAVA